jgi:pilus assembly protein CpaB
LNGISITKRAGGLLVAVLLAALATTALISYVHEVQAKAFAGTEAVQVYVARDTIPAGMTGDEAVQRALIDTTSIPRKVAADGSIASLDAIRGKVAAVTIVKGEQIIGARFVAPESAGAALPIPAGLHAMAVEVDTPPGVAGYLTPGAHVGVIAHVGQTVSGSSSEVQPVARFVLQDVPVLTVGQRDVTAAAQGSRAAARAQQQQTTDKVLVTLAVSPGQAEKLAYAIFEGDIYFTLLPPGGKAVATPGRTRATEFK